MDVRAARREAPIGRGCEQTERERGRKENHPARLRRQRRSEEGEQREGRDDAARDGAYTDERKRDDRVGRRRRDE